MLYKDEKFSCRICLEEDVRSHLIAPCACRGSQKYVHRTCLDRWRSVNDARAFGQCTECLTHYLLINNSSTIADTSERTMKCRYWSYVMRDLFLGAVLTQIPVVFLAIIIFAIDRSNNYAFFTQSQFSSMLSFYYVISIILSLSLVGIVYSVMLLCGEARASNDCQCCCCYGPAYHPIYIDPCCAPDCRCNDCGNDDHGKVFLLIIISIFALIGLAVSVFAGIAFVLRTLARHLHVLHKKLLTADYVVVDLDQTQCHPSAPPLQCDMSEAGVVIAQPYSGGDIELANATVISPLLHSMEPSAPPLVKHEMY